MEDSVVFSFFSPRRVSRISINGPLYVTYQSMITDTLHLLHDKDRVEDNEKKKVSGNPLINVVDVKCIVE